MWKTVQKPFNLNKRMNLSNIDANTFSILQTLTKNLDNDCDSLSLLKAMQLRNKDNYETVEKSITQLDEHRFVCYDIIFRKVRVSTIGFKVVDLYNSNHWEDWSEFQKAVEVLHTANGENDDVQFIDEDMREAFDEEDEMMSSITRSNNLLFALEAQISEGENGETFTEHEIEMAVRTLFENHV